MISFIEGKLVEKNPTYVIINCGGVGYYINISLNTYEKLPATKDCKILTHFIVREDAQLLYGFAEEEERQLFGLLIGVNGVGANTARMILSSLKPNEVAEAIVQSNVSLLQGVKGIGGKTAQRIIVDLKDKVGKGISTSEIPGNMHNRNTDEALSALIALGFSQNAANKGIAKAVKTTGVEASVEDIIKMALKYL